MNIFYADTAAPVSARWITQAGITGDHNRESYNPPHNTKGAELSPRPHCVRYLAKHYDLNTAHRERARFVWEPALVQRFSDLCDLIGGETA